MKGKFALPSRKLREIELQTNAGWVEWRYIGDADWTHLFELPSDGDDGREVELQTNGGYVQWRYVGDVSWTNLFPVPQDGNDGLSAYQVAVNNGFVGTEAEWLASLQGSEGTVELGSQVKYGALYNNYAAFDARNIIAEGWHIPTYSDIEQLVINASTSYTNLNINNAGIKLNEIGTDHWLSDPGRTNELMFNMVGSGNRGDSYGNFGLMKASGIIWLDGGGSINAAVFGGYSDDRVQGWTYSQEYIGYSIRPVKNSTTLSHGESGVYVGNNGRSYPTIGIGDSDGNNVQEWLACNLFETKYRNGDWITGYDNGIYTPMSGTEWAALTTEAMCIYADDETNATETADSTFSDAILDHEQRISDLEQCCEEVVSPEQSDWNESDPQSLAFIKNKPTITSNGDKNLDGGTWDTVYLPSQTVNGGGW